MLPGYATPQIKFPIHVSLLYTRRYVKDNKDKFNFGQSLRASLGQATQLLQSALDDACTGDQAFLVVREIIRLVFGLAGLFCLRLIIAIRTFMHVDLTLLCVGHAVASGGTVK